MNRREFLARTAVGTAGLLTACRENPAGPTGDPYGRLTSRRTAPTSSITPGYHALGLPDAEDRDGLLYVPAGYDAAVSAPLLVMLHGGGGSGADWEVPALEALLDELGCVMLAPDSRRFTWDYPGGGRFGVDVAFINQALAETFRRCNVDATAISIAGFSDGATEALGLGVMNGDLFSGVIAFSPGWFDVPRSRGNPRIFVSHGSDDEVFDAGWTRTYIVPTLEEMSYDVEYVEFDGGHTLPVAILDQAMRSHVG